MAGSGAKIAAPAFLTTPNGKEWFRRFFRSLPICEPCRPMRMPRNRFSGRGMSRMTGIGAGNPCFGTTPPCAASTLRPLLCPLVRRFWHCQIFCAREGGPVDQWQPKAKVVKTGAIIRIDFQEESLPQQTLFWQYFQYSLQFPKFPTLPPRLPPQNRPTKGLPPSGRLSSHSNTSSRRGFPSKTSSSFSTSSVLSVSETSHFRPCHPRLPCKAFKPHNLLYFFP